MLSPEYDIDGSGFSIRSVFDNLIKDFLKIAINIQRVDSQGTGDYLVEMKNDFEIKFSTMQINSNIKVIGSMIREYK